MNINSHSTVAVFRSFLLPQHSCLMQMVTTPTSFCGPKRAKQVVRNPMDHINEKPKVVTINIPNWKKNVIFAPSKKQAAPHDVTAPHSTEIPTCNQRNQWASPKQELLLYTAVFSLHFSILNLPFYNLSITYTLKSLSYNC